MGKYSVNQIPWNKLASASGTCEHYPNVFKELLNDDPKKIEEAYWQLDNHAVLQGDIYEVAPYVADILVEILQSCPSCLGRARIYDLLIEIAYGDAVVSTISSYPGKDVPLKEACDLAICQGIDIYLSDLDHEQREIRLKASQLLLAYSGVLGDKITLINNRVISESDQEIKKILEEILEIPERR